MKSKSCRWKLRTGEVHDCKVTNKFIEKVNDAEVIIADKGYDSEAIRDEICLHGSKSVIPHVKCRCKYGIDIITLMSQEPHQNGFHCRKWRRF
jgi:IS5 family transposase